MEELQLRDIGIKVLGNFEILFALSNSQLLSEHLHLLVNEEQRFRLWTYSLGLHQHGHASLDYRVRDTTFVKERLAKLLSNLQEHLGNLVAIIKGERAPMDDSDSSENGTDKDSSDGDNEDENATKSDSESHASSRSYTGPFHEVDFRLSRLSENLDLLYGLATKIRNPRNRPQRPVNQLYKHIPAERRATYIQEQEEFEITIIAVAQQQQIIEKLDPSEAASLQLSSNELVSQYATTSHWLIRRTGIANARRKQQFIYWKRHASKLRELPTRSKSIQPVAPTPEIAENAKTSTVHNTLTSNAAMEQASVPGNFLHSLATSATRLSASAIRPSDRDSVISQQSHVSTVINLDGERLQWPSPPQVKMIGGFFTCPYCKILCPERYLNEKFWKVHLVHDLQPYHCTYEDCQDPYRLYGIKQDWINHENQHSRVWHCRDHNEDLEFETQSEYGRHLEVAHHDAPPECCSEELVAAAAGPSLQQRRQCPFCPFHPSASPDEIIGMQKHITFHLERLALLALPLADDDDYDGSDRSLESHVVPGLGRRDSITADFSESENQFFNEFMQGGDEPHVQDHFPSEESSEEMDLVSGASDVESKSEVLPRADIVIAPGTAASEALVFDDLKGRVQPIYDRGEQLYRASDHASQHHQATTANEVLPTNIYELLDTIGGELDYALVVSGLDSTKAYIPRDELPKILTPQRVRAIVSLPCFDAYPDKDGLAADICYSCLKLLAVLIGIRKTHDFALHMADGVADQCLPMVMNQTSSQKTLYCKYHNANHHIINSYPRPDDRTQFSRWSYSLVAPYITYFNTKKHSHYILDPNDVFPMEAVRIMPSHEGSGIDLMTPAASSYGGFSEVHQVQIERSHYTFGDNFGVRHPNSLFSLKRLASHNRENFNLELSSLLYSMDDALKRGINKHLIHVLATFEVVDPAVQGSTYYLLFDWAEGNLTNFWKANPNLVGNRLHCKWISQQFHEISLALEVVHNERLETLKSIDNSLLEKKLNGRPTTVQELYGRHGDIKPDNFLWFHPRQPPDLLALSDFGLRGLHAQVSRSKQNPKHLTWTATYRAPEFDLPDGMISQASDIFSLGCVFLEHVTWFMRGINSVETAFPARRMDKDIHDNPSDTFFTIQFDSASKRSKPYLKPGVLRWISELQEDPDCSWYIHQLLEVIRYKMLEPDCTKRVDVILLRKEMEKLRTTCELNPNFYLLSKSGAASDDS